MKSFLDEIAYALVEKHQGNLRDVVVIVPNNRVSVFLRKALQKHLEGRGWLPELIPFADFIGNDSPLAVLPNASLIAMLYEIYAEQKGGDLFEHFIPTAQTILADFNELDSQLANPEQFFRDLQHLKALNFFLEDQESLTPFQLNYQAFWKIFEGCYFGLKEKLLANGAAYSGLMYRTQAEDRAWLANYRGLHLYFVGFSLFSKSEETIVRHCMDAFHAEVWSDTDRWYTENQMHEAGAYFRELRKKWKLEPSPFQGNFIRETPRKVEIVGTAKNIGQAVAAGAVLQQFQNSGKTTAVILPDEKLLQPLMAALPDNESVNITMGLPLKETAIADFVRYWLDMHLQAGKNKRRRFYHKDVLQLLQHPFTEQLLAHKNSAADCQTEIVRKNRISLTAADLEKLLENEPQLFQMLFQMPEDHLQLLSAIEQLLLQLLKNEAQLEVIHDREPVAIEKLLDTVRHLQWHTRNWKDHIAISSFIPLLLHELKTVRIPFESDQTEGIQLMGIFETRALDFDQVVILACNEGILPPSKKSNSFIPYEMRKAYELSTSDESDSTYSYLFYRLMQRAEQVVLLYNTESDVLGGGEKSRFILQLEQEWKKMTNVQMDESIFTLEAHLDQQEKPIVIAKSDEVFQQLTTYLEEKGLSPSALNTYINCSLQFYFRYLLGLGEQEEVEEEMLANTIGSAIHEALEEIYKPFLGVALQPADLQPWLQRDAGVMKLLKEHLIRRFSENNLSEGKNYLLLQVSEALIINFLKAEIARLNALHQRHQTLTVIRLEQEMRLVLQQGGRNILLKGITDRVERSEGITAIADYKTGDAVNPKLNIDDLEEIKSNPKFAKAFQLLMYAWLYDRTLNETQEPLTSGIYWLREGSKGLDTLKKNRSKAVLETQDLQAFESVLRDILGEMADRDRPFQKTEDRDRCVYCDFKRICARE